MTLCFANWKLNFSLYLTLWKYFVLAGWIMELIKVEKHVEKQFFVGFGFSNSGAWVMGHYSITVTGGYCHLLEWTAFPGMGGSALMCGFRTLIRSEDAVNRSCCTYRS